MLHFFALCVSVCAGLYTLIPTLLTRMVNFDGPRNLMVLTGKKEAKSFRLITELKG